MTQLIFMCVKASIATKEGGIGIIIGCSTINKLFQSFLEIHQTVELDTPNVSAMLLFALSCIFDLSMA